MVDLLHDFTVLRLGADGKGDSAGARKNRQAVSPNAAYFFKPGQFGQIGN
jgi:hypothetical protein